MDFLLPLCVIFIFYLLAILEDIIKLVFFDIQSINKPELTPHYLGSCYRMRVQSLYIE